MSKTAMPKNSEGTGARRGKDKAPAIGFLLKSLQHTLRQRLDEAMRKEGIDLTFAHFVALFTLQGEPGITGAQLARVAFVSAQTMNAVLHRLESDGLIERRPHPESRRADSWSLTQPGLAELDRAREVGAKIFAKMLAPLESDEIVLFESCLQRCITALGGMTRPGDASVRDGEDARPAP
jgi:DNA-binding MarR family transcriptional regulator